MDQLDGNLTTAEGKEEKDEEKEEKEEKEEEKEKEEKEEEEEDLHNVFLSCTATLNAGHTVLDYITILPATVPSVP